MEIPISVPLDSDGFLRRECPTCERQFKWFSGQTEDRPNDFLEPELYFCPYCGTPADHDHWWTREQLEHAQASAAGPISDYVTDELNRAFGSGSKSGFIRFEASREGPRPATPMPLIEPNDMDMVEPPCHPFEPLKIAEDWADTIHCLMCGEQFTI